MLGVTSHSKKIAYTDLIDLQIKLNQLYADIKWIKFPVPGDFTDTKHWCEVFYYK